MRDREVYLLQCSLFYRLLSDVADLLNFCGQYRVADIDFACGRYGLLYGRYGLWPILM